MGRFDCEDEEESGENVGKIETDSEGEIFLFLEAFVDVVPNDGFDLFLPISRFSSVANIALILSILSDSAFFVFRRSPDSKRFEEEEDV